MVKKDIGTFFYRSAETFQITTKQWKRFSLLVISVILVV